MKLAFCVFKYFPYGGLQRDLLNIAALALARGHAVTVFTLAWQGPVPEGLNLVKINRKKYRNHQSYAAFAAAVAEACEKQEFDCIIGFNKMPDLDFYYAADPCYAYKMQKKAWWRRLGGRYRTFMDFEHAVFQPEGHCQILSLSPEVRQEYQAFYHTPHERFFDCPPGIQSNRLLPDNAPSIREKWRAQWKVSPEERALLFLGSGFKTKGLDRALYALQRLRAEIPAKLFIIGQDQARPFKRLARRLRVADHVFFLGGRDDIPTFLQGADVLLHPAYRENTGTVLLEAVVAGLPVVTTAVCGYAHHVTASGMGHVLSTPYSHDACHEALGRILMHDQRDMYYQRARIYSEKADIFSLKERVIERIEGYKNERVMG